MNFLKLKELINTIPEDLLDAEVYMEFIFENKTQKIVKHGIVEGVLFEDNFPLKLIGIEGE